MYTPGPPIHLCIPPTDNPTLQYLKDLFSPASVSRPSVGAIKRFHHFIARTTHKPDKDSRRDNSWFADAARFTRVCTCNQERLNLVHIYTHRGTCNVSRRLYVPRCVLKRTTAPRSLSPYPMATCIDEEGWRPSTPPFTPFSRAVHPDSVPPLHLSSCDPPLYLTECQWRILYSVIDLV